jgi:putative glutamine amidotransferase
MTDASHGSDSGTPWIGITTYHRETEGRSRFMLPDAYVDSVRAAGGCPVLLTPGEARPAELLARLEGLILAGGGDLHPDTVGESAHDRMYSMCEERDRFELALVSAALERGTALLAICRGMQILNVALGGDVHAHLPDVVGSEVSHRASQDEPTAHPVTLTPAGPLARLFGREDLAEVASWHHQAVRRLGRGLRPVAVAADGTVEGLALEGAEQVLAVQWHPELQPERRSLQPRLFEALVARARLR